MIGIDIDSVTCDIMTPLLQRKNEVYGTTTTIEDIKEWHWKFDDLNGDTRRGIDFIRECLADAEFVTSCEVIRGAKHGIGRLIEKFGGDEVIFVTSRREKVCGESTRKWVSNNFGDMRVIFAGNNKNNHGLTTLIDDAPHNIESFATSENPFRPHLSLLFDCPWNRSYKVRADSDSYRVFFWREAVDIIFAYYDLYSYEPKGPKRFSTRK